MSRLRQEAGGKLEYNSALGRIEAESSYYSASVFTVGVACSADAGVLMNRDSVAVIAIVDDDEAVRTATASLVRSIGYVARTFASGEEFLRALEDGEPSCLIADVQMPVMDGVELQETIVSSGRSFPIIFMTAFPDEATRQRVMTAGAFCYLNKPSDGETIIQCIENALETPRPL